MSSLVSQSIGFELVGGLSAHARGSLLAAVLVPARPPRRHARRAVAIVDRAITPAVEKTAVDEGLEARKSPQRGRQTPQRPNDAKVHSIARRGGADLTSQTRAKRARRPNG